MMSYVMALMASLMMRKTMIMDEENTSHGNDPKGWYAHGFGGTPHGAYGYTHTGCGGVE